MHAQLTPFHFTFKELSLWRRATALVESIDANELTFPVDSHVLAAAVGQLLKLELVHGRYSCRTHTWLMTRDEVILDVFAFDRMPRVQLVHLEFESRYDFSEPKDRNCKAIDEEVRELVVRMKRTPHSMSKPIPLP